MHERHADVSLTGIDAVIIRTCDVGAGQRPNCRIPPQRLGRLLAVANIEPEEETPGGSIEAEPAAEGSFRDIELATIERAIGVDMRFVVPKRHGSMLQRQRNLGTPVA